MGCSLCGFSLPSYPVSDTEKQFCCHGCQAVYQILAARNALENYKEDPVFLQAAASGIISNPELLSELAEKQPSKGVKEKLHIEIGEMWCPSCAELIRLVLQKEKGILKCVVDYATDLAFIEFDPLITSKEEILERIRSLGYFPQFLESPETLVISRSVNFRFILAAFCSLNVMMLAYPIYATYFDFDDQGYGTLFSWLSLLFSLPVVTYCAWPILFRAYKGALEGIWGMEALVAIGVGSSFIFSLHELLKGTTTVYFDSMTVVVVFVLLGKMIESRAKLSSKSSLFRLYKTMPKRGRKKMPDGSFRFVPLKEIVTGDCYQVLAGEKFVLDGRVFAGKGTANEALMTGEFMPVVKLEGASVIAGSILQQGHLIIEVTRKEEDTTLNRILQIVEYDLERKNPYTRAIDPILKGFVPAVLVFALGVFFYYLPSGRDVAISRLLSVLLISCPCAIGIAVPLVESHLMHALTRLGVVIRNRGVLNILGKETVYVFDKTGTVTRGAFEVFSGLENLSDEYSRILKGLVKCSAHPIAAAINGALSDEFFILDDVEEIIGKGLRGGWQEKIYYLGSRSFLEQQGICCPPSIGNQTSVFFGNSSSVLSVILLGDQVRPSAIVAVSAFHRLRSVLLSGDARSAVEAVAKLCGFKQWYAETPPLEKRELIENLKKEGEVVCFIGDGINDAPALTAAQVGISVVAASDISIHVSDVFLTTEDLEVLVKMRSLALKAKKIIWQNLFWAFFYNIVGIVLAAIGVLSPIFAAIAMMLSSLIVLFNAQRLS